MSARDSLKTVWMPAADKLALSRRTREQYWFWTRRFFIHTKRRAAGTWTGKDWVEFEHALIEQRYSRSSRKVARSAINFVFRFVLKTNPGRLDLPFIARPEPALVVVPTRAELAAIFSHLRGQERIACRIMHGGGTRVEETARIRVQDVDLERAMLRVWDGKGEKNRLTVLPRNLLAAVQRQIEWRRALHERDLSDGAGYVELPGRLGSKYRGADRELGWQWLFASSQVKPDGRRWHVSPDTFAKALRRARRAAGIVKQVKCHSLRKAFATECAACGMDIRTIQALLGHADINTTAKHCLAIDYRGAFSPADVPTSNFRVLPDFHREQALALCA